MDNGSAASRLARGEQRRDLIRPDSVVRRTSASVALLVCDACTLRGGGPLRATLHRFDAKRTCGAGIEATYRCDECGALRRWGLE